RRRSPRAGRRAGQAVTGPGGHTRSTARAGPQSGDAAAKTDERAVERYDELYLINKFQQGEARFRLLPTQADRLAFFACVTRGAGAGGQDPAGQAYRFFRSQLGLARMTNRLIWSG